MCVCVCVCVCVEGGGGGVGEGCAARFMKLLTVKTNFLTQLHT